MWYFCTLYEIQKWCYCSGNDVSILQNFSSKWSTLCIVLPWLWRFQTSIHSTKVFQSSDWFLLTLLSLSKNERTLRKLALYLNQSFNRRKVIISWSITYAKMFTMDLSLCSYLVLRISFLFCTWSLTPTMFIQRDARKRMCKLLCHLWPIWKMITLATANVSSQSSITQE